MTKTRENTDEVLSAGLSALRVAGDRLRRRTNKNTKDLVQLRDIDSLVDRLVIHASSPDPLWGLISGLDLGLLETIETELLSGSEQKADLARLRQLIQRRPLGGANSQNVL